MGFPQLVGELAKALGWNKVVHWRNNLLNTGERECAAKVMNCSGSSHQGNVCTRICGNITDTSFVKVVVLPVEDMVQAATWNGSLSLSQWRRIVPLKEEPVETTTTTTTCFFTLPSIDDHAHLKHGCSSSLIHVVPRCPACLGATCKNSTRMSRGMRTVTESPDALIIAETTSVGSADPAVDCAGVARNLRFNGMSCRKDPTHVECLEVRPDFQLTEQDETYQWIRHGPSG